MHNLVLSDDVNDRKYTAGNFLSSAVVVQHSSGDPSCFFSEVEFQGMAIAVQEALHLKQFLEDLGIQQKHPIKMERTSRVVSNCAQTQSCTRVANTMRWN